MNSLVAEAIEKAKAACGEALSSHPLSTVDKDLNGIGYSIERRLALLSATTKGRIAAPELLALESAVLSQSIGGAEPDAFARCLLVQASLVALSRIADLPVGDAVKCLFCKEFLFYANPPAAARSGFSLSTYEFGAMSRIALLSRFPAGQHQWEISAFPRSWLPKVRFGSMAKTYSFLATQIGGFKPYFVPHLAVTSHRIPFFTEREYWKSFRYMAEAIEKQPAIKAIMGCSWLHSTETHRVNPHLAFLNRPYLEAGGIYTDLGPIASTDAGFLAGDANRAELYRTGQYKPTLGIVLCTREQAIAWRLAHPEAGANRTSNLSAR